jgi:hypothetical protein
MEMKFMRRTAKYTWKDYKTNEDILSELIINPAVQKIRHYRNKNISCSENGQRQTAALHYKISTMWEMKPRMTPQRSRDLNLASYMMIT